MKVALINQKGGVGKTTSAVTLAHGLALQGKRVLLVDLDAQGNVADSLRMEKTPGLYQLLIEGAGTEAVTPSGRRNLDVIVGDKHTVQAKESLVGRHFREFTLRKALETLPKYDAVLIDVAPSVDLMQINALIAADAFIIPVALEHLALVGATDALNSAAALKQEVEETARFLGILPTFWERTTSESQEQLKALVSQYKQYLWFPIPRDTKAREATAHGQTLWEYAPDCRALAGVKLSNGKVTGGYKQALARLVSEMERGT